jgi:VIT1/CCC1 family predicted Fe2+/Mn2+ transporter
MTEERNSLAIDVDNRMVDVASKGRHAARIPDTPERQRLERQRNIRQVVFGAQDGVLTTLGIVTGLGGATNDRATILLTGFLSLLVGAISMGVGEYLGGKAEREVVQNAIAFERQEMIDTPDEEYAEQLAYYRLKGFSDEEAQIIVARLAKNPDIWLHEMVRDEFGIDLREAEGGSLGSASAMAASFAIGAALPVVPYLLPIDHAATRSCSASCSRPSRSFRSAPSRGGSPDAIRSQRLRDRRLRRGRLRHLVRCRTFHPGAARAEFDQPRRLAADPGTAEK